MHRKIKRTHVAVAAAVGLLFALAAFLALTPSGLATATTTVVPFDDARLPMKLEAIAAKVAMREEIATDLLVTVSPSGGLQDAGVFVGRDAQGDDVVSPFNADGMMGFTSVDRISNYGGVMVFPSAAGDAGQVKQVSLVGIAEPRVGKVTIELADGSSLRAALVTAGQRGFKFFAYATDSSSRFPIAYKAHGTDGIVIKNEDISPALAPPRDLG